MEIVELAATNSNVYQYVVDSLSNILDNIHRCCTPQEKSSFMKNDASTDISLPSTCNSKLLSPNHVQGPGRPQSKRLKVILEKKKI